MHVESVNENSTKRASCNSHIEEWLASSQLDTALTNPLESSTEVFASDSSLSLLGQTPWKAGMSVLHLPPTHAKIGDAVSVPSACLESKGQQALLGEHSRALQFENTVCSRPYDEYRESSMLPTTSATPFGPYPWSEIARNLMAINPRDTLTLSPEPPDLGAFRCEAVVDDRESTNSSPEDDVHSETDVDIRSVVTPATTFSPSSSSYTLSGSNNSYSTLNSLDRTTSACTSCPLSPDQYELSGPTAVDIGIAPLVMAEPEVTNPWPSWLRSHNPTHSPGIPRSVPLDCRLNTDLTSLGFTWNTPTEYSYQGTSPDQGASSVSLPNACSFPNQMAREVRLFKHNDSQTLRPSDLWSPPADVHASELPFPDMVYEARELDSSKRAQLPVKKAASNFSLAKLGSHHSRAGTYSNACPVRSSRFPKCKKTHSSDRLSGSRSQRRACDEFLVRSKLAGKSYRDIRLEGRFTEAESTLRGRFRTLTKRKEQRVRKPQWHEKDVSCSFFFQLLERLSLRTRQTNVLPALDQASQAGRRRGSGCSAASSNT